MIIGKTRAMLDLMAIATKAAEQGNCSVVITGETGTGKELLAEYIHTRSPRGKTGPLVAINCSALNQHLIESELFGHERGAFTGAFAAHPGVFEQAYAGTVFLDEIGEMSEAAQAKLLRVAEKRLVRRIGATKEIPIDVRIVCATNANLEELVQLKRFRQDLFYRLNVVSVRLPPLRERREDIDSITDHLLGQVKRENPSSIVTSISSEARTKLRQYSWPGNIRELRNVVERMVIACEGTEAGVADMPLLMEPPPALIKNDLKAATRQIKANQVREALIQAKGNVSKAARSLGMNRTSLVRIMVSNEINPDDFRSTSRTIN
ncbi:MAG TPA: sigma-54 dependent transcriptional regulator [Candidatus Udaeobacter sp.]|nr:sigma-54 dependent transcriptional regulator [Candidatus Udaeobacter sp.]